jgi:hypothetical protein
MTDGERWLLEICGLTLGVLLLLLVFAIWHRWHLHRRLDQISDQLAEGAVDNGETLKGVVKAENDATRRHVSGAVDAMRSDTKNTKQTIYDFVELQKIESNEFRGQLTGVKDRVQHLIKVADGLADRLRALPGQIKEWIYGPKEPPPP